MAEVKDAEILNNAATQVLETMFFTSIMGERDTPPDGPVLSAMVSFHGAPSGRFALQLSADAARAIAANFLGSEDDSELTEQQIGDVACELANMICGAVLSQIESNSTFDIGHPELSSGAEEAPLDTVRSFDLDTGALTMSVAFDRN